MSGGRQPPVAGGLPGAGARVVAVRGLPVYRLPQRPPVYGGGAADDGVRSVPRLGPVVSLVPKNKRQSTPF